MNTYTVDQLFDIAHLRRLLESHHEQSGMTYALFDADDNNLIAVGWQDICVQYHRLHPVSCVRCHESNAYISKNLFSFQGDFLEHRCANGMFDVAFPVVINGTHVATFYSGQFFYDDDRPDRKFFESQSAELGFDKEGYLAALDKVPVFSRDYVRGNMRFLRNLINGMAETVLDTVKRLWQMEKQAQAEDPLVFFSAALDHADPAFLIQDGRLVYANRAICSMLGYSAEELASMTVFDIDPLLTKEKLERHRYELAKNGCHRFETVHKAKDGHLIDVEVSVTSLILNGKQAALSMSRDITERKRMEEALAAREREFRTLAENTPDPIYRYDRDCRRVYVNPAVERIGGKAASLLLGKTPAETMIASSEESIKVLHSIKRVLETGMSDTVEITFCAPDGGVYFFQNVHLPEYAPDGTVESVLSIGRDITDRKRLEAELLRRTKLQEQLQAMQSRLSTIFATIPDLVWLKDAEGVYRACNPAFEQFFGATEAEIIGKTDYDFVDAKLADFFRQKDCEAMSADAVCINEEEITYAIDGRRALLETRKVPVYGANGQVIGVLGIARDITERKRMEDALQEQNLFLDSLLNAIPAPIFFKDTEGRYIGFNRAFEEFYGTTKAALIGKSVFDTFPREQAERFHAADLKLFREAGTQVYEAPLRGVNGIDHTVLFHKAVYFDKAGKVSGLIGAILDITERKRIEEELQQKNSELERFAYTVSHDLKSPVITIKSFTGSIKHDLVSGRYDRVAKDLDRISVAADKMTALLDDLLKLSRVGRIINTPELVAMAQVVDSVLKTLAGTLRESGMQVIVQPDLPSVMCDRQRMLEVLQNLIENAVKYRGDQPQPRIEIGMRQDGGQPVFFVQDNGPGIEPCYHENIFGLFNRLDTRVPGTGIGLALVKRIIETHGGSIWVESDGYGHGSTFCFTVG